MPRSARSALVAAALTALACPLLAPAVAPAKPKPAYTKKGKLKHPKGGSFRVEFSGEGNWKVDYTSHETGNNLSTDEHRVHGGSYKWRLRSKELMNVPQPCKVGTANLCAQVTGVPLTQGTQSYSYTVADQRIDSVDGTTTQNCSASPSLDAKVAGSALLETALDIHGTKSGTLSVGTISATQPVPFLGTTDPAVWLNGAACHGLDGVDLWQPGDSRLSVAGLSQFFAFKGQPIPVSALATSNAVTLAVSGPSPANAPKPNCGIASDGVTCSQTGEWRGTVTFTRVGH